MKKSVLYALFILSAVHVMAQESDKEAIKPHKISLVLGVTHISAPYEAPENPDIEVSHLNSIEESVEIVYDVIKDKLKLING